MPIYEYVCAACGHRLDVMHGIHDTGPSTCERCGGATRKALSAPAIVFKGSGWAKKDARDARSAATASKPAAGDGAAGDGAEAGKGPAAEAGESKTDSAGSSSGTDASTPASAPAPAPSAQTKGDTASSTG